MVCNWLADEKALELVEEFGSPLYVYDENTLRKSCADMRGLLPGRNFRVSYSIKANSNIRLLMIIQGEDIDGDALSPGEIYIQQEAGFSADRIFFIPNNASAEELMYAVERGIVVSVDSLSQLDLFGRLNPGGDVAVRFNPSAGLGHHDKVVTAGKATKFGVQTAFIPEVKELLAKHGLRLVGINHHLGSLVMTKEPFLAGAAELLETAKQFPGLEFIDFGGGFGVPYREDEPRLDLADLSMALDEMIGGFLADYDNKDVMFRIEPGRYIVAECGVLLGTVTAVKTNYDKEYIGTDLGFNVLMRPVMYDSYHAIQIVGGGAADSGAADGGAADGGAADSGAADSGAADGGAADGGAADGDARTGHIGSAAPAGARTVVGNICESGDILAKDRELPAAREGDVVKVLTAGAYAFSMSSNYNQRPRPAEILINADGTHRLIRRRETFEDLLLTSV